jgi:hypothetical protein
MNQRLWALVGLAVLGGGAQSQVSRLYLNQYDGTNCWVVQGGNIVNTFQRSNTNDGSALVVQNTVKMFGRGPGSIGREYSLGGAPLGGTYNNPTWDDCYDGASDGAGRNWTIAHNDFNTNFAVIQSNASWGSPSVAWVPGRRSSGITYDPTDDTLWITNNVGGSDMVQHYTTGGALLGQFAISMTNGGGYAIALDLADQTLWVPGAFGTAGTLLQYSKAGTLLNTVQVAGLGNVTGAEFQAVPEPASLAALSLGALALLRKRRK